MERAMAGGVLIIEDDEDIRVNLCAILRVKGFEAHAFANGEEALSALRQGARPSLLVLDLMMPVMNGWEFRNAMRGDSALDEIPVVVVSGAGSMAAHETALLQPAAVLVKPFELSQLLELVARYCPRSKSSVPAAPGAR
jgi:CheY-like chemotaxis protein